MLLSLCQEGRGTATVTRLILQEAEKNLQATARFRDAAAVFRQESVANMMRESPAPFSQELAADSACIRTRNVPRGIAARQDRA